MEIRHAGPADLPELERLYAAARAFMAWSGNPHQWGSTEPARSRLEEDIALQRSYVCEADGGIAAAFMFTAGPDPLYAYLEGSWCNDLPYSVVHRLAAGSARRGAGSFCLNWAFARCGNLRIDTHRDNLPMQKLLQKLDFRYCGITLAPDGTERLAFQKTKSQQ